MTDLSRVGGLLDAAGIQLGLAGLLVPNGAHDVVAPGHLDQMAGGPSEDRCRGGHIVGGCGEEQAAHGRFDRPDRPTDLDSRAVRQLQVQQHDVCFEPQDLCGRPPRGARVADDLDVPGPGEQIVQTPPDDVVIVHQVDPVIPRDVALHAHRSTGERRRCATLMEGEPDVVDSARTGSSGGSAD